MTKQIRWWIRQLRFISDKSDPVQNWQFVQFMWMDNFVDDPTEQFVDLTITKACYVKDDKYMCIPCFKNTPKAVLICLDEYPWLDKNSLLLIDNSTCWIGNKIVHLLNFHRGPATSISWNDKMRCNCPIHNSTCQIMNKIIHLLNQLNWSNQQIFIGALQQL